MEMVDDCPEICEEEIAVSVAQVKDLKAGQYVALTVKVFECETSHSSSSKFWKDC